MLDPLSVAVVGGVVYWYCGCCRELLESESESGGCCGAEEICDEEGLVRRDWSGSCEDEEEGLSVVAGAGAATFAPTCGNDILGFPTTTGELVDAASSFFSFFFSCFCWAVADLDWLW